MKPLIVGEVNPYGSDPVFALYPLPKGASGDRLCRILGMSHAEYLRTFDRANLCAGEWSLREARLKAEWLILDGRAAFLLLGRKVAYAFQLGKTPFFQCHYGVEQVRNGKWVRPAFLLLPHPSGRCRAWNKPGAVERARKIVTDMMRATK